MHRKRSKKWFASAKNQPLIRNIGLALVVIVIFSAGWLTGSGKLVLRQSSPVSSNKGLPNKLDYSSVDTIYQSLKSNFDGELDEAKLIEGLKTGLAKAAGDPYTEYMNPEAAKSFSSGLEGTFEGIGAELGKNESDSIIVISPISGYPAEKAGLKAQDIIVAIDGDSAVDLSISEAVDRIRGEKGTTVTLTVISDGSARDITITRETIDIPSVKTEIRDGVGIMTISRFGDDTVSLARKAANEFTKAKVSGIVLDLRGNTGGYLDGAVKLSSLWLDRGTVVLTERRDNVVIDTLKANGNNMLKGIKTVILIDESSASASEIVAGALRDNNAATIVGQKSYGKGSVQQPINLGNGGILKITIARWFTPGGKNIDKEGIEPDEKVEITSQDIEAGNDTQLNAALDRLKR